MADTQRGWVTSYIRGGGVGATHLQLGFFERTGKLLVTCAPWLAWLLMSWFALMPGGGFLLGPVRTCAVGLKPVYYSGFVFIF